MRRQTSGVVPGGGFTCAAEVGLALPDFCGWGRYLGAAKKKKTLTGKFILFIIS